MKIYWIGLEINCMKEDYNIRVQKNENWSNAKEILGFIHI